MAVLSLMVASFALAGFAPETLIQAGVASRLTDFVRRMLPLDLSWAFVSSLGTALLQTIAISLMGTLIGMAFAVILAVPATSTLTFLRSDSPGKHGVTDRVLRWLLFWSARLVLNILRSIPELVWVLICILAVGIPLRGYDCSWTPHGWRAGQTVRRNDGGGAASAGRSVAFPRGKSCPSAALGYLAASRPSAEQLHGAALGDQSTGLNHVRPGWRGRTGAGNLQQRPARFLPSLDYPYPLDLRIGSYE